ncbi:MAG TPA: hypothetical protein VK095_12170, partial [Beutenbergiaceae bacterium]|nr:hypothetical protein [Beutenbergiaceae bacterium]
MSLLTAGHTRTEGFGLALGEVLEATATARVVVPRGTRWSGTVRIRRRTAAAAAINAANHPA